jgi:hypothetical protein
MQNVLRTLGMLLTGLAGIWFPLTSTAQLLPGTLAAGLVLFPNPAPSGTAILKGTAPRKYNA